VSTCEVFLDALTLTLTAGIECQANQGAESEGCTVAWGTCNVSVEKEAVNRSVLLDLPLGSKSHIVLHNLY
jgi:hypothetical protein